MAVTMGPLARYVWTGLSGDTKPTDLMRVNQNDVFLETDTQKWWVFNGTTWSVSKNVPLMRM
jgi:hypothetical protein